MEGAVVVFGLAMFALGLAVDFLLR